MELSEEQIERLLVAQESMAQSLSTIAAAMPDILTTLNKSPWEDPTTKALLDAALAESGTQEDVDAAMEANKNAS